MQIDRILVTGDQLFYRRHQPLFTELAAYYSSIDYLAINSAYEAGTSKTVQKYLYALYSLLTTGSAGAFRKTSQTFMRRSLEVERAIQQNSTKPDLVFHLFGLYAPFWNQPTVPYVMYLDYTMSLARRNWEDWAKFRTERAFQDWVDCERHAYQNATHVLTMSNLVKQSLIQDYGVAPERVTVVGSSTRLSNPSSDDKQMGSHRLLFNGSDFKRKGGDIVLEAFEQVRQVLPDATLTIVGKKLPGTIDGIDNPGHVSSNEEMRNLFFNADLVVAPARCEPFAIFVIEAMSYGVPCIVTDRGAMKEIVDHGVNGVVLPDLDPKQLADNIISLLQNPSTLQQYSQGAKQKVQEVLNWRAIAQKVSVILNEL